MFLAKWASRLSRLSRLSKTNEATWAITATAQFTAFHEQIAERIGHHAGLAFEYNAIVNAIPKEWKRQLNKNQLRFDTGNDVVSEAGQISSLTNKQIRNIIAKQSNQDICE